MVSAALNNSETAFNKESELRRQVEDEYAALVAADTNWRILEKSPFHRQFWSLADPFHAAMEKDPKILDLLKDTLSFGAQFGTSACPDCMIFNVMSEAMAQRTGRKNGGKVSEEIKNYSIMLYSRFGSGLIKVLNQDFPLLSASRCQKLISQRVRAFEWGAQRDGIVAVTTFCVENRRTCLLSVDEVTYTGEMKIVHPNGAVDGVATHGNQRGIAAESAIRARAAARQIVQEASAELGLLPDEAPREMGPEDAEELKAMAENHNAVAHGASVKPSVITAHFSEVVEEINVELPRLQRVAAAAVAARAKLIDKYNARNSNSKAKRGENQPDGDGLNVQQLAHFAYHDGTVAETKNLLELGQSLLDRCGALLATTDPESVPKDLASDVFRWRSGQRITRFLSSNKFQVVFAADAKNELTKPVAVYMLKEQSAHVLGALLQDICRQIEAEGAPVCAEVYVCFASALPMPRDSGGVCSAARY